MSYKSRYVVVSLPPISCATYDNIVRICRDIPNFRQGHLSATHHAEHLLAMTVMCDLVYIERVLRILSVEGVQCSICRMLMLWQL